MSEFRPSQGQNAADADADNYLDEPSQKVVQTEGMKWESPRDEPSQALYSRVIEPRMFSQLRRKIFLERPTRRMLYICYVRKKLKTLG